MTSELSPELTKNNFGTISGNFSFKFSFFRAFYGFEMSAAQSSALKMIKNLKFHEFYY